MHVLRQWHSEIWLEGGLWLGSTKVKFCKRTGLLLHEESKWLLCAAWQTSALLCNARERWPGVMTHSVTRLQSVSNTVFYLAFISWLSLTLLCSWHQLIQISSKLFCPSNLFLAAAEWLAIISGDHAGTEGLWLSNSTTNNGFGKRWEEILTSAHCGLA